MQATIGRKRNNLGPIGMSLVAVGFAAGILVGGVGQTLVSSDTASDIRPQVLMQPKAHYSSGQGEGLLNSNLPATSAVRAHDAPFMGEGIVGGNREALTAKSTTKAHTSIGMGEGWLAFGKPTTVTKAYYVEGQGEGWLALEYRNTASTANQERLRAPGEGIVGGSGQR
jgi:hypothetical protein